MSRYYCTVYLDTIYIYMSFLGTTGTLSSHKRWSDHLIISSIVVSLWRDPRRGKWVRKQPPKWKYWYVRPAVSYHSSTVLIWAELHSTDDDWLIAAVLLFRRSFNRNRDHRCFWAPRFTGGGRAELGSHHHPSCRGAGDRHHWHDSVWHLHQPQMEQQSERSRFVCP